jgi:uncharacterized protein (TIGR03083 family)
MDAKLLDSTVVQTREVSRWIEGADPAAPVPTCPGWTLTELVEHIGSTQRWVATLVAEAITDPGAAFALGWAEAPADPSRWPGWLLEGADGLQRTFEAATDGRAVFDPSGGDDGVTFWSRRSFGEISVHRIDAAFALDRTYQLDPPSAAAAIEDWLSTIASSGWAANVPGFRDAMRGDGQRIAWVADDADRAWLLRRTDAPLVLDRDRARGGRDADADVTISGPACELLQIVSRRRRLDAAELCTVAGDRRELDHLIDNMNWVGAS